MKHCDWKVELYADSACLADMREAYALGLVRGFTVNPAALRASGVTDYRLFAKTAAKDFSELPIFLPVLADDAADMEKEARELSAMGDNVFVRIPVVNTRGMSSLPLVKKLSQQGIHVDVTAVFTLYQVKAASRALSARTPAMISVFAGKIADTGVNARRLLKEAAGICRRCGAVQTLWTDCREPYHIIDADQAGCGVVAVPMQILKKLRYMDMNLYTYSLNTVREYSEAAAGMEF